jgi:hypothetical protein
MLTALFTSSDRQLDTKERRRYELKLSKAPNMRTAIIALLAIFVIASGLTALGAEIKVTDVGQLAGLRLRATPFRQRCQQPGCGAHGRTGRHLRRLRRRL